MNLKNYPQRQTRLDYVKNLFLVVSDFAFSSNDRNSNISQRVCLLDAAMSKSVPEWQAKFSASFWKMAFLSHLLENPDRLYTGQDYEPLVDIISTKFYLPQELLTAGKDIYSWQELSQARLTELLAVEYTTFVNVENAEDMATITFISETFAACTVGARAFIPPNIIRRGLGAGFTLPVNTRR